MCESPEIGKNQHNIIAKPFCQILIVKEIEIIFKPSLIIGVWSVAGRPCITVIRKTVMLSMVCTGKMGWNVDKNKVLFITEIPRVIFSPDSAGIKKTNLSRRNDLVFHWSVLSQSYSAKMLIRTAGWMQLKRKNLGLLQIKR